MMKNKNNIISLIFLIIIFTISILTILTNNTMEVALQSFNQVRETSYPSLSLKLKALSSKLESTYNEHIIFKKDIVMPTNIVDYMLFHKIDSKAALLGKDNWLFYKTDYDGKPIEDYRGINPYTEEQLEQITENIKNKQEQLKQENVEFHILIAPNKEQVYSNYMPTDINIVNEDKKVDKLIRHLKENNINVIDPKEELLEMRDKYQIYYKNDTHWNKLGAFIGAQHINKELLGEREELESGKIVESGTAKGFDLLNILGLTKYNKDKEFDYISKNNNIKVDYKNIDKNLDEYTSNAESDKKILFIGDSFRIALEDWLPKYYSKVDFIHRSNYKPDLMNQLKPDVVIYEIVERQTDEMLKTID